MSYVTVDLRRIYYAARQWVHPLVDSIIPVNYTPDEVQKQKKRLDPHRARHCGNTNEITEARILKITSALGVDQNTAKSYIDDAHRVTLLPDHSYDKVHLASPMSYEDRYTVYVITRAIAPSIVVETGVAHGVSSAYILAALQAARHGKLISIELSHQTEIGRLIPPELKSDWTLVTGDSLEKLPEVCQENKNIDMFIHDSYHVYQHMRQEYDIVWPYITPGGILCSHDILTNNCFSRFIRKHRNEIDLCIQSVNFGLLRKRH